MMRSIILAVFLLVSTGLAMAKPRIELLEAVKIAKQHIAQEHLSTTGLYLASVHWNEDFANPEKSNWSIMWMTDNPTTLDGQLVIWVWADGRVTHQDGLG